MNHLLDFLIVYLINQIQFLMQQKHQGPKQFTIKCQCTFQKNNIPLVLTNKSKFYHLSLVYPRLSVLSIDSKTKFMEHDISKIRKIQKKFIEEGKLTIQIFEGESIIYTNQTDISLSQPLKRLNLTHIFINNSSRQNLELFIAKLTSMITLYREKTNKVQKKNEIKRQQKINQKQQQRKTIQSNINRKMMRKAALQEQKQVKKLIEIPKSKKIAKIVKIQKSNFQFFQIPPQIFKIILSYTNLDLKYRLVCKLFSTQILNNIKYIKLNDNIDQQSFKKLTKTILKIDCRMRNVKDISHFINRYSQGQLNEQTCKWLKFSKWKQITYKNINQLKTLRIYCLQIPYNIKFQSESLIGLNLVYLKLKSNKNILNRNPLVLDSVIIKLINTLPSLTKIQIDYIQSAFLQEIQQPEKMEIIKIGALEIKKNSNWTDLKKFIRLSTFGLKQVHNLVKEQTFYTVLLPQSIRKIKFGDCISLQSIYSLNQNIQSLKLSGQHIRNHDISNMYFPNLKMIDIRECPCINYIAFENCYNIELRIKWEDYILEQSKDFLLDRNIQIVNQKIK